MKLCSALVVYILTIIISVAILYICLGITMWSSIALSLLIGIIVLLWIYSPIKLSRELPNYGIPIYITIIIVTPIILAIYIIGRAAFDFRKCNPLDSLNQTYISEEVAICSESNLDH